MFLENSFANTDSKLKNGEFNNYAEFEKELRAYQ